MKNKNKWTQEDGKWINPKSKWLNIKGKKWLSWPNRHINKSSMLVLPKQSNTTINHQWFNILNIEQVYTNDFENPKYRQSLEYKLHVDKEEPLIL